MSGTRDAGSGARDAGGETPAPRKPRSALRLALLGIALLLLVTSPLGGPLIMRRMAFFRVRRVEILGAHYVAPADILAKLHVDTTASVWDATAPLAARGARTPGLSHVQIRRKLPGTLVIEVTERIPVALVQGTAGLQAYDAAGGALPADPVRVAVDAPVLDQRDTTLLRLLGEMRDSMPSLYDRVSAARRVGRNREDVLFELASLPVLAMPDITLDRLAEIDPILTDLARRGLHATELDLRYRDQVIARLP